MADDKRLTDSELRAIFSTEVDLRVNAKTADYAAKLKAYEEENAGYKAAESLRASKAAAREALAQHKAGPALAKWLTEDKDAVLRDLDEKVERGSKDPVADLAADYDKWSKKWAKLLGVQAEPQAPDQTPGSGPSAADVAAAMASAKTVQQAGISGGFPTVPLTQVMMDLNKKHGIA